MSRFFPQKQGLYSPDFEHDNCGIGVVCNIKGIKSNKIVKDGIDVLMKLDHRGARGAEENTGDGAGILIQIPHKFFKKKVKSLGFELPDQGEYGVGMLFMSPDENVRNESIQIVNETIENEGLSVIGWRDVPLNGMTLGKAAAEARPYMMQIFVGKNSDIKNTLDFDRKLYVVRRLLEKNIRHTEGKSDYFYVCSLSCKTIIYKGMLIPYQMEEFFLDLLDTDLESSFALVHSRFSTNTFPSWERAHPNRYMIHNGEINTLRGNVNKMRAREKNLETDIFDLEKVFPIIDEDGSDSAMLDNALEFMYLTGKPIHEAMMMMIPEPWEKNHTMPEYKKDFYQYYSCLMEPWDGPAGIVFTYGEIIGASLYINGLRPSRYYVTKDDILVLASESGVLDIKEEDILIKERLRPGRMLLVNIEEGRILSDEEVKMDFAKSKPFKKWIDENMINIEDICEIEHDLKYDAKNLLMEQKVFGYTYEELKKIIYPMCKNGVEGIGAMGNDAPLAVLSDEPQLLFNYFKQLFAQVTNPPIDAIREEVVTSSVTYLGTSGNLLKENEKACRMIKLKTPFLYNSEIEKIRDIGIDGYKTEDISILFDVKKGFESFENVLNKINKKADQMIEKGTNIIILTDRGVNEEKASIPSLLAVSSLHHYLVEKGTRSKVSIVIETGEAREVHHFAVLLGYGVDAINPYLAFETIAQMIKDGLLDDLTYESAVEKYIKAGLKGVIKTLSKMGISAIQSYRGAQIFEAIGISSQVVDKYFERTPTRIEGLSLEDICKETLLRHKEAFDLQNAKVLKAGGSYQWRSGEEYHLINPETVVLLQQACYTGDYNLYKEYVKKLQNSGKYTTLRDLIDINYLDNPISIDEVEPVESIVKRFKTGAMSYGSISQEAHECLAIAMNRLGGKSNSGEGGELLSRYTPLENGDSKSSRIKQVASGRFGVSGYYLANCDEIQIKIAQGAKPGEGGQLPEPKVYPWIANNRNSTPGVGLISPPPHHDIYSIEDLAQLIHDLKNANPSADINVKLVSEVGVGTIAAGVAKGLADVIVISGYDGGTGASPRSSIKHTGLPWELGLSETHQTLLINELRGRVKLETDGKLMSGKDLLVAALLGAEEYGFATLPLIVMGCIMMRVCNLDTCPVGVATQNPDLRKNFIGKPEYVVNFMKFMAQNMREEMAKVGVRTINELVGRIDLARFKDDVDHWKARNVDLSTLLYKPEVSKDVATYKVVNQNHKLEKSLDYKTLKRLCREAIENGEKIVADLNINNVNRTVGTILGNTIHKKHGLEGLQEDTINLNFKGSAGQSFGAFIPKGMTLKLLGDANDYIGKGISGGKIIVKKPDEFNSNASENIIIGNVAFYGGISGEAFINGVAGERFCVRNSGVNAVVEGVGDHGCEYMTGGRVVVIGKTGINFAAGMSGGIAYVLDEDDTFKSRFNDQMSELESLGDVDIAFIKEMLQKHIMHTNSEKAKSIIDDFYNLISKFKKVIPFDYKRVIESIEKGKSEGLSDDEAKMNAFILNKLDKSRASGN